MRETGKVVEITGSRVRVEVAPNTACRTCAASTMCQPQGTARYVEADNRLDARVGDDVCIEIPTIQSMIAMVLVFGVPVVLALIGLILGAFFGNVPSMLLGAIGFVAGLVIAKIINDVFARTYFLPRVVEIARQAKDLTL